MIFVFLCLTSLSMIISRSTHVAANGTISFFLWSRIFHCVYAYHIFLVYSSTNEHLGGFHVLAIANSAAANIGVHAVFSNQSCLWIYTQEWDCWILVVLFFSFLRNLQTPYCSPQWLHQFAFPPTLQEASLFSTPLLELPSEWSHLPAQQLRVCIPTTQGQ